MTKLFVLFAVIAVFAVAGTPAAAEPLPSYDWSDIADEITPADLDVGEEMC